MNEITKIFIFIFATSISTTSLAESTMDIGQSHALFREAMSNLLGVHGKQQSSTKAFHKFELLARQGWKTAQLMLGNLYAKGEGTTKDQVRAYFWYSMATRQDFNIAEEKLTRLTKHLTQTQINEAEWLVSNWKNER